MAPLFRQVGKGGGLFAGRLSPQRAFSGHQRPPMRVYQRSSARWIRSSGIEGDGSPLKLGHSPLARDLRLTIDGERLPRRGHIHQHVLVFGTADAVGHFSTFNGALAVVFDFFHGAPPHARNALADWFIPSPSREKPRRGGSSGGGNVEPST